MNEEKIAKINRMIEMLVVILMGITALLTAWATWIGSLHAGNQATNYTLSNNLASEGNSEYNAGSQLLMQDMLLWNEIADLQFDISYAAYGESDENLELLCEKLYFKLYENLSEQMAEAIAWYYPDTDDYVTTILEWIEDPQAVNSPFFDEDFLASYFVTCNDLLYQSQAALEQGQADNSNGDSFGLVTVIYSVALFILGMVSTMNSQKNKYALLAVALVSVIGASIFMLTLPMPTGFSLMNFL